MTLPALTPQPPQGRTAPMLMLALLLTATGARAAPPDCAALARLPLAQARVDSAQAVAAGTPLALWAGGTPVPAPIAFCRISGTATPVPGSEIGFELWLPGLADWNGKTLQAGNGGTAGNIPLPSLMDALRRGYASAATDGGHRWPDGLDYGWAPGHPERVTDFGWRAVERTEQVTRALVAEAYGQTPKQRYFVGCSDGGRDAMMAAQRLPEAFDGIIAGAPALAWLDMMIGGAVLQRQLAPPAAGLPVAKLPALQAAALARCGAGQRYIAEPEQCRFDPAELACSGAETAACLTPGQIEAARQVYRGPLDPGNGRRLPGLMPGAEAEPGNWDFWLLLAPTNPMGAPKAPGSAVSINESFFRHLVRQDDRFRLADLTDQDLVRARQRWQATLDATDPDLSRFRRHGGKLLQYHGWNDSAIPPRSSIDYHQAVQQRLPGSDDFHRLFMVPGMNHCAGGAGPWMVDWLTALERWVEAGEAPERLIARHPQDGGSQMLRPYRGAPTTQKD